MNDNGTKIMACACEFVMRHADGKLTFIGINPMASMAVAQCNAGKAGEPEFELLSHFAMFDESVANTVASMTSPNLLIV